MDNTKNLALDSSLDAAKAAQLAQKIVEILATEESIVRQRAVQAAMMLLGEAAAYPTVGPAGITLDAGRGSEPEGDAANFFNRDGDLKPADNALLCAAYHFSQFGSVPFSTTEIKAIAADAGVIIPSRVDKTFSVSQKKGKKLFQSTGKGSFKPTTTGSLEFGERWGVKPGRKAKNGMTATGD